MGVITICTVGASALAEETTNRIMLILAIGGRPRTLALKVESSHFLGAVIPVGGLGLRAWCLASLGLVLA